MTRDEEMAAAQELSFELAGQYTYGKGPTVGLKQMGAPALGSAELIVGARTRRQVRELNVYLTRYVPAAPAVTPEFKGLKVRVQYQGQARPATV